MLSKSQNIDRISSKKIAEGDKDHKKRSLKATKDHSIRSLKATNIPALPPGVQPRVRDPKSLSTLKGSHIPQWCDPFRVGSFVIRVPGVLACGFTPGYDLLSLSAT
jgi:hypothetical protein